MAFLDLLREALLEIGFVPEVREMNEFRPVRSSSFFTITSLGCSGLGSKTAAELSSRH
jgi:hypothetical protein